MMADYVMETAAEAADRLRDEGLTLIPLGAPGEPPPEQFIRERCDGDFNEAVVKWPKTPRIRWQDFQHREPTDAEWHSWRTRWPTCNWAILTGKRHGIVVVDADSQAAMAFVESGGITRPQRWVDTAKGRHYYYAVDPNRPVRNSAGKARIDIRGEGGYVVAPGSVHLTGVIYTEHVNPAWPDASPAGLPTLTPDDLAAIARFNNPDPAGATAPQFPVHQSLVGQSVDVGQRNVALAASVGAWINEGIGFDQLRGRAHAWNASLSSPLPAAEVDQTLLSILTTHTRRHEPMVVEAEPAEGTERSPVFGSVVLSDLATAELLPVEHIIESYLPRKEVTLLGGHGGSGKSQLALAWLAHIACGRDWGGVSVTQGKALCLSLEDRADIVRYRLRRICQVYELPIEEVIANLTVVCATGDNPLAVEQTQGGVRTLQFTRAMDELQTLAAGMDCICIDNASDAYAGDEIMRRQVRAFVSGLARLAAAHDAAVLLLVHIDKASAKAGSGGDDEAYSGSTGWHNSARSRVAISTNKQDGTTVLRHAKANHGAKRPELPIEFEGGVLVPRERSATIEHIERENDDLKLLAAFRAAASTGEVVPAAQAGPRTWFHVLGDYPEFAPFTKGAGRQRARAALLRLKRAGQVVETEHRNSQRKPISVLELAQELAQQTPSDAPVRGF